MFSAWPANNFETPGKPKAQATTTKAMLSTGASESQDVPRVGKIATSTPTGKWNDETDVEYYGIYDGCAWINHEAGTGHQLCG